MFIITVLFTRGMDITRLKRYKDKINFAGKRLDEIEEWQEGFLQAEKDKLACYKAMQEAVEACLDIVAMAVKDEQQIPKDDYTNVDVLKDRKIITPAIAAVLIEANGLRNRIVHEYNGLDDYKAYQSLLKLLPPLDSFLTTVEQWLKTNG